MRGCCLYGRTGIILFSKVILTPLSHASGATAISAVVPPSEFASGLYATRHLSILYVIYVFVEWNTIGRGMPFSSMYWYP